MNPTVQFLSKNISVYYKEEFSHAGWVRVLRLKYQIQNPIIKCTVQYQCAKVDHKFRTFFNENNHSKISTYIKFKYRHIKINYRTDKKCIWCNHFKFKQFNPIDRSWRFFSTIVPIASDRKFSSALLGLLVFNLDEVLIIIVSLCNTVKSFAVRYQVLCKHFCYK